MRWSIGFGVLGVVPIPYHGRSGKPAKLCKTKSISVERFGLEKWWKAFGAKGIGGLCTALEDGNNARRS